MSSRGQTIEEGSYRKEQMPPLALERGGNLNSQRKEFLSLLSNYCIHFPDIRTKSLFYILNIRAHRSALSSIYINQELRRSSVRGRCFWGSCRCVLEFDVSQIIAILSVLSAETLKIFISARFRSVSDFLTLELIYELVVTT